MLRREDLVEKSHQLVEEARTAFLSIGSETKDGWLEDLHREFDRTIDTLSKNPQFCCQQHMSRLKLYRLAIKRLLMKQQENTPALA